MGGGIDRTDASAGTRALGVPWVDRPEHRAWLRREADDLLRFFERAALDPAGGFHALDTQGRPDPAQPRRELHSTARMVHCFSLAALMGRPGAETLVDHGMGYLWQAHRDADRGGYVWSPQGGGPHGRRKLAYGQAFVLLAGASAKGAGHPNADRLLADAAEVIRSRFWEEGPGAVAEQYEADWSEISGYRGQNSNMHMTEALMAAHEATGEPEFLEMAERIAALIIDRHARACGWRVAEHFDETWRIDESYSGDPMFRPAGTTPGHALEWARLLVQLWELGGRRLSWPVEAAEGLFRRAAATGWDAERGGFYYTLDWEDRPNVAERYWWPCAEAVGAAHALHGLDVAGAEGWYRASWEVIARLFIDRCHGGWHAQLDAGNRPGSDPFFGKPDLYHALQACLLPLYPVTAGLATHLARENGGPRTRDVVGPPAAG